MANEKRLIDANVILKEKTVLWDTALGFCDCVLVEDIDKAPTVDAVEVVHGRWERYWSEEYWTHFHSCSVCLAPALTKEETMHDEVLSNYCPNCGAKMRGSEE